MKFFKTFLLALLLVTIVSGPGATTAIAEVEDAIVAVVNDEVITLKDLKDYMRSTIAAMKAQGIPPSKIEQQTQELQANGVNTLIEDKLLLSEAKKQGIEISDKMIDEQIKKIESTYPSHDAFVRALVEYGSTISDLREKVADQLSIKYLVDQVINSKIKINPQEVTEYYEKHRNQFQNKEQADLDSIYIPFGANKTDAKEKIKKALQEIQDGTPFSTVAKKYSQTASIGIIEKGQVLPAIETAVFELKEGGHSSIIEVATGYYIFKLKKLLPAKIQPIEEVKPMISKILHQKKYKKYMDDWLKELKDKAYVEIKK